MKTKSVKTGEVSLKMSKISRSTRPSQSLVKPNLGSTDFMEQRDRALKEYKSYNIQNRLL